MKLHEPVGKPVRNPRRSPSAPAAGLAAGPHRDAPDFHLTAADRDPF
jgi:hypothetical protein